MEDAEYIKTIKKMPIKELKAGLDKVLAHADSYYCEVDTAIIEEVKNRMR